MRRPAFRGVMTMRAGSLRKPRTGRSSRSPGTTTPLTWQMRVVRRRMTGVSNCSERAKASRVIS